MRAGDPPPAPPPLAGGGGVTDTHCHLDLMGVPVEDALAAARAVGVDRVVQVGIDVATSRRAAEMAAAYAPVVAAVAIHPNDAPRSATGAALAEIEALAALPQVRAVGETGLDHYRTGPEDRPAQEEAFRRHIDIAKRHDRTLVIHDRDAHADVLRVLAEEGAPERVVFHCFSGDEDLARVCGLRGWFLSFAGTVTFRNAAGLRAAAAVAPRERLLVETDAPFLTPHPHRGRPNAPYLVPLTVRCLADVVGAAEEDLAATLRDNTDRAFGGPW